ncbi:hypothetical protein [uncultured Corynebacterium sp.]|uniref:hypothetical protein n=1 Tax=uncultured Corynebacterium sp. TaxID=159447 RepID=UPI0025F60B3C|nr:hypothetical protein [uncultured Corynebacterium sp.]
MPKNSTVIRTAACGAVVALGFGIAPVSVLPQALASPATAQQTYTCAVTVDENPTEPSYMDLTANITLNLPDRVAPGDAFSVDGTFQVQLPGEIGALFAGYFPFAQVTSDALTLPVNVAGQDLLVRASRIDSGRVDTRNLPVVFTSSFSTDTIAVPADAGGEVAFSMPRNDSVPSLNEDGTAAFTATLFAEGGIVPGYDKGTDRVSCRSAPGESAPIGSVAVSGAAGAGAPTATTGGTGAVTGSGAVTAATGGANRVQAAQGAASPSAEAVPGDEGDDDGADANAVFSRADQALVDQLRLMSMNQAASGSGGGSYLSKAAVCWGTLCIVTAAVLFTVLTNARTRRLDRAEDRYWPGTD